MTPWLKTHSGKRQSFLENSCNGQENHLQYMLRAVAASWASAHASSVSPLSSLHENSFLSQTRQAITSTLLARTLDIKAAVRTLYILSVLGGQSKSSDYAAMRKRWHCGTAAAHLLMASARALQERCATSCSTGSRCTIALLLSSCHLSSSWHSMAPRWHILPL